MKVAREIARRFWAKFEVQDGGCWQWTACTRSGYGLFSDDGRRMVGAHRFSYELFVGPIPDGLEIDHLCRNRGCVNPSHLEVVTHRENILRGTAPSAIYATWTHCKRGHPLSGDNLRIRQGRYGEKRVCRACIRRTNREHYLRRVAA